jgi:predicted transcriptional regulator
LINVNSADHHLATVNEPFKKEFALKSKSMAVDQVCVHAVVAVDHDIPLVECAKIIHDDQVGSLLEVKQ